MEETSHRKRRIGAVIAATCVSLACGTNYAYSAWGPQFAEKLQLSATQSNLIVRTCFDDPVPSRWSNRDKGAAGNMGMYATGVPLGFITDKKGPYLNTVMGAFAMAGGYWFLRQGKVVIITAQCSS
jgi:phosphate/sulfate permease